MYLMFLVLLHIVDAPGRLLTVLALANMVNASGRMLTFFAELH